MGVTIAEMLPLVDLKARTQSADSISAVVLRGYSSAKHTPRAEILFAVGRLIDETGRWSWSIREICDEACVPYNAFHRTFGKRAVLVDTLVSLWMHELGDFIAAARGLARLELHLAWLAMHRRRIQFLVAEAGVMEGRQGSTTALESFLPSGPEVRSLVGFAAESRVTESRQELTAGLFLMGYLTGFGTIRASLSTSVGFDDQDFAAGVIAGVGNDESTDAADVKLRHLSELVWLRDSFASALGIDLSHHPLTSEVCEALGCSKFASSIDPGKLRRVS